MYYLYADSEEDTGRRQPYRTILQSDSNHPFIWSLHNDAIQIFDDICQNPHYTVIPVLSQAHCAMIFPLRRAPESIGSLGIFVREGIALSQADLLMFEQFSSQLAAALHNVHLYQETKTVGEVTRHELQAIESFMRVNNANEIVEKLAQMVKPLPFVANAIIWLNTDELGRARPLVIDTAQNEGLALIARYTDADTLWTLLVGEDINKTLSISAAVPERSQLGQILDQLGYQHHVRVPIRDSTGVVGGMIVSVKATTDLRMATDIGRVETLANAAGLAFERVTLTHGLEAKNSRLEAVLRSVSEGIFFVDQEDQVVFCNPQVMELTSVNVADFINRHSDSLLQCFANLSDEPTEVFRQLREAKRASSQEMYPLLDYPIIELRLQNLGRIVDIEFIGLTEDKVDLSWCGVIREVNGFDKTSRSAQVMLNLILERFREPNNKLHGTIKALSDQPIHHFSHRERMHLLHQAEDNADLIGRLWNDLREVYNLKFRDVHPNVELVDVCELIIQAMSNRPFDRYRQRFKLNLPTVCPPVQIDHFYSEHALTRVLNYVLSNAAPAADIVIDGDVQPGRLMVSIYSQLRSSSDAPDTKFAHADQLSVLDTNLDLLIAREIITRQGGQFYLPEAPIQGVQMTFALPPSATPAVLPKAPASAIETAEIETQPQPTEGAPHRTLHRIMLIEGQSVLTGIVHQQLQQQGYEVVCYGDANDALCDLVGVRFDVIVLDAFLVDDDGIEVCKRIRAVTEIPIILIADDVFDRERVRGLTAGADEFITASVSNEEMVARIQVIFKRQIIPDRTRPPLLIGDLHVDFSRREVRIADKPVQLTRIEYELLHTLIVNRGQVLTHKQLLAKVWGPEYDNDTQYLWVNISRLRKKLAQYSGGKRYIHNQQGIGYLFESPDDQ